MSVSPHKKQKGVIRHAKLGAVYGAAVGSVVGFIYEAIVAVSPGTEIVVWRNFVVAGAVVGLLSRVIFVIARGSKTGADKD